MNFRRLSIFAGSVLLGAVVPLAQGCGEACPREMALEPSYRILGGHPEWVQGSGRIEVTDTTVTVFYTTTDGSAWEVEYRRTK